MVGCEAGEVIRHTSDMAEHDSDEQPPPGDPKTRRRRFGDLVNQARQRIDTGQRGPTGEPEPLGQAEFGTELDFSPSKMSKIARGIVGVSDADTEKIITVLTSYGALTADQATELRELAPLTREYQRPKGVARASVDFVLLEAEAVAIDLIYNEVPGLLQTEETASAALSRAKLTPSQVTTQARARAERGRRLLRHDGPTVRAILGQDAVMRAVGGDHVLLKQLEHLIAVSHLPSVSVLIVPWAAGSTPGLSNPFTLLHLPPDRYRPEDRKVAYDATLTRTNYTRATAPYEDAVAGALQLAANEADSRTILASRIEQLRQGLGVITDVRDHPHGT